MPSKKPTKTRDNATLVNDALILIQQEGLSYGTKWAALDDILWHWTEREGKFHQGPRTLKQGCKLWSKGALQAIVEKGVHPRDIQSKFRHEHVVPRSYLKTLILSQNRWKPDDLKLLLETCCIAVIVTTEEDKKLLPRNSMPENWDWTDVNPWARYTKIEVCAANVKWEGGWQISGQTLVHPCK